MFIRTATDESFHDLLARTYRRRFFIIDSPQLLPHLQRRRPLSEWTRLGSAGSLLWKINSITLITLRRPEREHSLAWRDCAAERGGCLRL